MVLYVAIFPGKCNCLHLVKHERSNDLEIPLTASDIFDMKDETTRGVSCDYRDGSITSIDYEVGYVPPIPMDNKLV